MKRSKGRWDEKKVVGSNGRIKFNMNTSDNDAFKIPVKQCGLHPTVFYLAFDGKFSLVGKFGRLLIPTNSATKHIPCSYSDAVCFLV